MRAVAVAFVIAGVIVCVVGAVALAIVPNEWLGWLESVPAKRILGCGVLVNASLAVVAGYYLVALPSPRRVTFVLLTYVTPMLGAVVAGAAGRPSVFKIDPVPPAPPGGVPGVPGVEIRFDDPNLNSVLMLVALAAFTGILVLVYWYQSDPAPRPEPTPTAKG